MMESFGAHRVTEDTKTTFILKVVDGNTSRPLAVSGDVPQLTGEIPGDDRGEGLGENVLALPGGD